MKYRIMIVLAATLIVFGACKKESTETTESATTDTVATAETATQTTATDTTASATTTLSNEDQEFVKKAGMGGLAEVQMGTLEQQKGTNPDAKSFGERMVTDHSKANQDLQQLASSKGVTLPTELEGEHKAAYDHLSSLSGAELDKAYMEHMVDDHTKDVDEFQKASQSAQDPDVKAFATRTLPTLQQHLQLAKDTQKKLKK